VTFSNASFSPAEGGAISARSGVRFSGFDLFARRWRKTQANAARAITTIVEATPIPADAPADRPEDGGSEAGGGADDVICDELGNVCDDPDPTLDDFVVTVSPADVTALVMLKMFVAESVTMVPSAHTAIANWFENRRSLVVPTIHLKKVASTWSSVSRFSFKLCASNCKTVHNYAL